MIVRNNVEFFMGTWRARAQPASRLVIAAVMRMPSRHLLWWLLLPTGCTGGWWLKRGYGDPVHSFDVIFPNVINDSEGGDPPIKSSPSRFWWFVEYTPGVGAHPARMLGSRRPSRTNTWLYFGGFSAHCLLRRSPDLVYTWRRREPGAFMEGGSSL